MNVVLRVHTNERTFILKQSRPFVQKYQDIQAPLERIAVEQLFYRNMQQGTTARYFPTVLQYAPEDYLIMLQDLGDCEDMTASYDQHNGDLQLFRELARLLSKIHQTEVADDFPANTILRELNHQHIFVLPFLEENGFALDSVQPGLQLLSEPFKRDTELAKTIKEIGAKYLAKGTVLLHGDYYPGSWMRKGERPYVIDPEFSFVGFPEFDVGVMVAHSILIFGKQALMELVLNEYAKQLDVALVRRVAGIEIMRRIIGLAQLPMKRTLTEKERLLELAHKMILQ